MNVLNSIPSWFKFSIQVKLLVLFIPFKIIYWFIFILKLYLGLVIEIIIWKYGNIIFQIYNIMQRSVNKAYVLINRI